MLNIIISNFLILSMFAYMGYSIMPLRFHNNKQNIALFSLCLFLVCLTNFNGPSMIGLISLISIHFIYFFIVFKGNTIYSLLILLPFPLIIIISEFLVANILNLYFEVDASIDINSQVYLIAIILSNLIIMFILVPYIKLSKLFIKKSLPNFTWMIFILPITTFLFLFNLNEYHFYVIRMNDLLFISIIGLLISNLVIIFIFYKVIISYEDKKELLDMKNKEKLFTTRYHLIKDHHDTNLAFLHNLLHQCKVFNDDLEKSDYDQLRVELDELYAITFKEFNMLYSNSTLINSLINERLSVITKNHINIKTVLEYDNFNFLSLYEQEFLFSTLLDIAITSSINFVSQDKHIILKTSKKGKQIIISTVYSCDSEDKEDDHQFRFNDILKKHQTLYSKSYDEITNTKSMIIIFLTEYNFLDH